jgi:hypothetical protein
VCDTYFVKALSVVLEEECLNKITCGIRHFSHEDIFASGILVSLYFSSDEKRVGLSLNSQKSGSQSIYTLHIHLSSIVEDGEAV